MSYGSSGRRGGGNGRSTFGGSVSALAGDCLGGFGSWGSPIGTACTKRGRIGTKWGGFGRPVGAIDEPARRCCGSSRSNQTSQLPSLGDDLLPLRSRLRHFHPPALPLRCHLRPDGGDACGAGGLGGENTAVEEVVLPFGEELPVNGAATGGDGNWPLAGEMVEEQVMLGLVVGDRAGVADRGVEPYSHRRSR